MARTPLDELESTIDNADLQEPEERPNPKSGSAASLTRVEPSLYDLKEELGRGGMGRVIQAHDLRLDREVAIKELLPIGREALPRFIREAMVTAKLQHPGILPIYEAGRWPSGKPFYSMKLISGRSLGKAFEGSQSMEERLRFLPNVLAACEAVAYAHAQGVIHRDLKPDNIMLGSFGETIVIDWGLAKETGNGEWGIGNREKTGDRAQGPGVREKTEGKDSASSSAIPHSPFPIPSPQVTAHGHIIGTPAYMPLEQAHGEVLDARADVYSLGAILYELLSGNAPYTGGSTQEVLLALHQQAPAPISQLAPRAPRELFAIVEKAMARQREARYPTAKELAHDLRRFQEGQLVAAYQYTRKEKLLRWVRQNRAAVTATAAALFVIAGVGVVSFINIKAERDTARLSQAKAEAAQAQETLRADELTILQARDALNHDPTETLDWIAKLSEGSAQWGAARILAQDAKEKGISKRLTGHTGAINGVEYSPDGSLLASVSDDGTILLRDTKTDSIKRIDAHQGEIFTLIFSHDGKQLATAGSDRVVKRWQVDCLLQDKRDCATTLEGHTDAIVSLAFSPDDLWLASASYDKTLRIWGSTDYVCPGHQAQVWKVAFSPDGLTLATASWDNTIRLWDKALCEVPLLAQKSGTGVGAGHGHLSPTAPDSPSEQEPQGPSPRDKAVMILSQQNPVTDLAFSPDGQKLASIDAGGGAYLWDLKTKKGSLFYTNPNGLETLAYSHNGKLLAAGSTDGSVLLWKTNELSALPESSPSEKDKTKSKLVRPPSRLPPNPPSVSPPPINKSPGGSRDPIDSPLDIDSPTSPIFRKKPINQTTTAQPSVVPNTATEAQATPEPSQKPPSKETDEKVSTIKEPFLRYQAHYDSIGALLFSLDDKRIIAGSYDNTASVFTIERKAWRVLIGHSDRVYDLALSRDGLTLATASWDRDVRLWDIAERQSNQIVLPNEPVREVLSLPDGESLTAAGGKLYFWKPSEPAPRAIENNALVASLALSSDGKAFAVGGIEGSLRLYETSTKTAKLLSSGPPKKEKISLVSFSPDGALLASAGNEGVWLFTLDGQGAALDGMKTKATQLVFSPSGKFLAASDASGNLYLWEVSSRKLTTLKAHQERINALAFSPDESQLASASDDHFVCLVSLASPSCKPLKSHSLRVTALAFSPDGKLLASGSEDRSIRIWSADGELLRTQEEHKGAIMRLMFVGASELLSLSTDGTARLYETEHWQSRALFAGGAIVGAAASSESQGFFVLSSTGALRYFEDNLPREEAPLREWCKAALP